MNFFKHYDEWKKLDFCWKTHRSNICMFYLPAVMDEKIGLY